MQTKFKRHDRVKLLVSPDPEYVEYYVDEPVEIRAGMVGEINILLPNGQYHVEIEDENGEAIAYAPMDEESLELIE